MTNSLDDQKLVDILRKAAAKSHTQGYSVKEELDELKSLILQREAEVEKAYGGCHLCYGKGYATYREGMIAYADFEGDKDVITPPTTEMRFCECSRGKQLAEFIDQREAEVQKETKHLVEVNLYTNAIRLSSVNNQTVGENNDYYITLQQLEYLIKQAVLAELERRHDG